jgi:hypothetical protein
MPVPYPPPDLIGVVGWQGLGQPRSLCDANDLDSQGGGGELSTTRRVVG